MQNLKQGATLQGGKYRIERVLGQGGFGNTYNGYNTEFEEVIAIKEFFMRGITERNATTSVVSVSNADNQAQFEEQKEKFKKEARRLRKMRNEHIVKVHDLFEENGTAYYVMDYIDGESLSERIKRTGRTFSEKEVMIILPQVLTALEEVHGNGIWHLDLKPGNIMIDRKGFVKLIDFGASKQLHADGNMTTSTAMCYTPGYAPNEQIGQLYDRFGPWTDIYALGATIYNLLTNKKPPMAVDIEEDGESVFEFPDILSSEMRKLVVWMMQPRRKDRPQSVGEVRKELAGSSPIEDDAYDEETVVLESEMEETKAEEKPGVERNLSLCQENNMGEELNTENELNDESTILVIRKTDSAEGVLPIKKNLLPARAIDVGDYLFDDGNYSDSNDGDKSVVGVLLSKYGGAHGVLVASTIDKSVKSINGIELKWHEATVNEWIKVIENLGHAKVYFENGTYRYYSQSVRECLDKYMISGLIYVSGLSSSNVYWQVDLKKSRIEKVVDTGSYPKVYISEF